MTISSPYALIKKSREDYHFITTENLFFNPTQQMDVGVLLCFYRDKEEHGLEFYDSLHKLTHYRDRFGNNLLHMAEVGHDRQLAYWLITNAPDLMHAKNQFGHYPAHFAAAYYLGLQKYPSEFFLCNTSLNQSMLHVSALFGSISNMHWLLKRTDLMNTLNSFDGSPLHCACNVYSSNIALRLSKVKAIQLLLSQMDEKQRKRQLQHKSAFGLSPHDYMDRYLRSEEMVLLQNFL